MAHHRIAPRALNWIAAPLGRVSHGLAVSRALSGGRQVLSALRRQAAPLGDRVQEHASDSLALLVRRGRAVRVGEELVGEEPFLVDAVGHHRLPRRLERRISSGFEHHAHALNNLCANQPSESGSFEAPRH